ncbi:MAG TPA: hypothetical protein VKB59_14775 [Micromonosporaceae bacterium]|nr:hypothetical protein [Micromonosporaceae bacterium]
MSRRAIVRTACAVAIGLGVVIPAAAAAAGPPPVATSAVAPAAAVPLMALADCCQASIHNLPSRFVIGGNPTQFNLVFTNTGQQSIASLTVTFAFTGSNLDPDQITMKRMSSSGQWRGMSVGRRNGQITATDSRFRLDQDLPPNGSTTLQYQLSFDDKEQPARVQLGATVTGRFSEGRFTDTNELAHTSASFTVGTIAPPKPKPNPTPTPTVASAPPSAPQSAGAIDTGPGGPPVTPQNAASSGGGSSLVWVAYIVGGLLLLGGIGAIGMLLWRRGPETNDADWPDDGTTLQRGGGVYPAIAAYPTQPLPPAPQPYGGQPESYGPADPYGPPTEPYSPVPEQYGPPNATPHARYGRHSADRTHYLDG